MSPEQIGPDFLKQKYDKPTPLHLTPEVESAVKRNKERTGEPTSSKPTERIQTYLERLKNIFNPPKLEGHSDFDRQKRNMEMLKNSIFDKFVTKLTNVPDSYLERQLRDRGLSGDYNQASDKEKQKLKRKNLEPVLRDQQASLEQWIDYFGSTDSNYMSPILKYWVFREITSLSEYDKDNHRFPKRDQEKDKEGNLVNITVNKFPDLNQEALGYVIDAVQKKYQGKQPEFEYDISESEKENFKQYLSSESFAKLYAWSIELINPIPEHLLKPINGKIEGKWKKYSQGSNHRSLVDSIRRKGTGWCTAGENTAKTQLSAGDFYVFYSLDDDKKPTIPRIAIRMEGDNIGEIRGIGYKQNMDPYIDSTDVLKNKLGQKDKNGDPVFPNKDQYLKQDHDMRYLTDIERKTKKDEKLTKEDLIFLYEIDNTIEGFGYNKDPRIEEIKNQRNTEEDMLIIFDCTKEQIAHDISEIRPDTKAYIGEWNVEIFQHVRKYPDIKHFYESFPDKKIFMLGLETDPSVNSFESANESLAKKDIYCPGYAEDILKDTEFSKEEQRYNLVRFTVKQLGLPDGATTEEIYKKAEDLGLELCPAEVGPHLRLQYSGKEWMLIAMKQITNRDDNPGVFTLDSGDVQLSLNAHDAEPSKGWSGYSRFVFRFRK